MNKPTRRRPTRPTSSPRRRSPPRPVDTVLPAVLKPEPPMDTGPRLDTDQVPPAPAPPAPADDRAGLVITLVVVALLLAVGAATTWRIQHRRPRPEPTT